MLVIIIIQFACVVGMAICYIHMVRMRNMAVDKLITSVNRMMEVKVILDPACCAHCSRAHTKLNEAIGELS